MLAENGLVHSKYLGYQRQVLSDLQHRGPLAVVDPTEMYIRATVAHLLPRIGDTETSQVCMFDKVYDDNFIFKSDIHIQYIAILTYINLHRLILNIFKDCHHFLGNCVK
jgi:hypothetical protein